MTTANTMFKVMSAGALALALQACGGGSSAPAPSAPTPSTPPPAATGTPAPTTGTSSGSNATAGSVVPPAPGGFKESPLLADPRPRLASAEVGSFLPTRGPFTFPAPYKSRGARITNESDCNGSDCVQSVGYSYWKNINNHVHDDTMYVFVGLNSSRGGTGPTLFSYNKVTEEVTNAGPLFDIDSKFYSATGEGWYFSATLPNALYVRDGSSLVRYDVVTKTTETVFNVATEFGAGHEIWQTHSSNDDRVHSATLRSTEDYQALGCIVYFEDSGKFERFDKQGSYDECQIDKSGRHLLIKENIDGSAGEDNRIIDLHSGKERVLKDEDGAAGHSDLGYGSMVAADNHSSKPNAQRVWDFLASSLTGPLVYQTANWDASAPAHVSYANARDDVPLADQYACGSSASKRTATHANEVVCFMLDGSEEVLVVAPTMTDLEASGGGSDSYSRMPKGNLDVTGEYFVWTSNMGGGRQDLFIVRIPSKVLTDA
ncbi:MAG: hypothetical protein WD081_04855 [Gammaproteobacteria bacterium]